MRNHLVAILAMASMTACGRPAEPSRTAEPAPKEERAAHDDHAAHATAPGTDGPSAGGPWMTDRHTAESMARIEHLVAESPASAATATLPDHVQLGTEIQAEVETLIAGCTMTGAAHDQLHVFLGVFLPRIAALRTATDAAAATQALAEVKESLAEYRRAFEAPQ